MKNLRSHHRIIPGWLALLLATGCAKHSPAALAPDQIPGAINQAFSQATGETKDAAAQAAAACQQHDAVGAFTSIQALAQQRDLTPEERSIAARAEVTCLRQVQAAAEQGDASAQAVLHQYLSTR